VEHQRISVRIREQRHVAHPGVERVAMEADPALLERTARSCHVVDVQRNRIRTDVVSDSHLLGVVDAECQVARLELRVVPLRDVDRARQPKRLAVERDRGLEVAGRETDEIDAADEFGRGAQDASVLAVAIRTCQGN